MNADIERIRSALFYLSADMPRNEWAEIAMALKSELGEDGFELFNKWSEKSDKYNARDIRDTWRSCKADRRNHHRDPLLPGQAGRLAR